MVRRTMAIADAATVAAKWAQRASQAQADYVRGAETTDKDPSALAIAALPRYLQRVQEAFNSGKTANALRRSGKAGWLQGITSKGAANYATGVSAAQDKFAARIAPVLQFESALQSRINTMPNISAADRRARMLAWFDGMSQYHAAS
jgi:hypothetical protein